MDPHSQPPPPPQAQQNRPQPVYDTSQGGHYGASAALAQQGYAPSEHYTGPWANVHQGLTGPYKDILTTYWQQTINHLESDTHDYKLHQLPLARIKKVMKADPDVKMISAEAPILFAKGCDIFITELTMRAWIHAEENKRRTLQRSDIASALAKSDMFDFLIPRGAGPHLGGEADYRQAPNMYPVQGQPGAPAGYGQPQASMYGEMDPSMYGTYGMQPQQSA
ncbi:Histone-fold protein [Niveomyces insectorum RCEF 264]|uniref:Histone-fold protein n=1 Tax=Niveomyces insectorum RCEF 264 TaxID=1081102 RepID=A0A167NJ11_9HYPO|nr:Histone-fold protein [Niveomyces insectorum RCEF 264]